MGRDPLLERALARLLSPRLGHAPSRWPETLYLHLRERALAAGQSEAEYVERVGQAGEAAPLAMLLDAATIGHTAAYRHPEQFERLRRALTGAGLAGRRPGPLRIWCAGCSTGEEAYCAAECAEAAGVDAAVLGTDVNPVAIAVARSGLLPQRRAVGAPLPAAWAGRVPEALRRRVRFEVASLTAAQPALGAGPFDVIFCRNVLIYFEREQVPRLLARLAAELVPGGYLILSPAEGILPLPPELGRGPAPGWLQLAEGADAPAPPSRRAPGAAVAESAPPSRRAPGAAAAESAPPSRRAPGAAAAESAPPSRRAPGAAVAESAPPSRRAPGVAAAESAPPSRRAPGAVAAESAPAQAPGVEEAARLLSAGRAADAEQVLSGLLNADPDHLEGWFLLGEALVVRGERAQARAAFLRVLRCSTGGARGVDAEALRRAAARRAEALRDPR
ncbi:CheR family methyltransferase [Sorangium sp. So ce1182]|uniref:CheR family methyltransferase n=1 Tax=Sorangium sp. So ce1182 TaxID=3133334 RepID=UPI003F5FE776